MTPIQALIERALDAEKTQLMAEIDRIATSTTWAGQNLLDGTFNKSFQVGGGTMAMDSLSSSINDASIDGLVPIQPERVGNEFQVAATSASDQENPEVIYLKNGNILVSWTSDAVDVQGDVYGRIFDGDGNALSNDFLISDEWGHVHEDAEIIATADGGFLAIWTSFTAKYDLNVYGVLGQKFDSTGNALSDTFLVNTTTALSQYKPYIAELSDGKFVTGWVDTNTNQFVKGQLLDANGNKIGSEFQINSTNTSEEKRFVQIAGLSGGGFVVSWASRFQDGLEMGVYAQLFDANANRIGGEFQVHSTAKGKAYWPSITALGNGGFAISFAQERVIKTQFFDSSGNTVGEQVEIGQDTVPNIQRINEASAMVSWVSTASGSKVFGQIYDNSGNKIGTEFEISSDSTNGKAYPDVASNGVNRTVAVWQSSGQDGDGEGIFAQIFEINAPIDLTTAVKARASLTTLNTALQSLNSQRASLGALSNRIDHIVTNNTNTATNIARSISRIEDADFAAETTNLAKQQILQQAATAMLAQANASKQNILTLLNL